MEAWEGQDGLELSLGRIEFALAFLITKAYCFIL